MINNQYDLYMQGTFRLVETMLIKFEDAANAINEQVILDHGVNSVDLNDKTSWKYYQNISGIYHFSDTQISVTSLDTLQTIRFDKDTLALHPNTLKAYQYETRYYRSLINQYPGRELLILGILYAKDSQAQLQKAINSPDGTILSYQENLIEDNEVSLLTNIQNWIYVYLDRWVIKPYAISDDLYVATYLAQLYIHLVCLIVNLRLRSCKTNEVHSYHLKSYLASNNGLDIYLNSLTKEQALFLYRNILYIEAHAGKQDTFDWLIENLFTKRNLSVVQFDVKHRQSNMLPDESNNYALTYTPELMLNRDFVNRINVSEVLVPEEFDSFIIKVNELTDGNSDYHDINLPTMIDALTYSPSSTMKTKFLESSLTDYSNYYTTLLPDIAINQWISDVCENRFVINNAIELTKTKRVVLLDAKDTLIFMLYLYVASLNGNLQNKIGKIAVKGVINDNYSYPVKNKFYSSVETRDAVKALRPINNSNNTTNGFFNKAKDIFDKVTLIDKYMDLQENENASLEVQQHKHAMFCYAVYEVSDLTFEQWITQKGIDLSDYTFKDYYAQLTDLVSISTGLRDNETVSLKSIQSAMISIFKQLSSYSISFIDDVRDIPVHLAKNKMLKIQDIIESSNNKYTAELTPLFNRQLKAKGLTNYEAFIVDLQFNVIKTEETYKGYFENTILTVNPSKEASRSSAVAENTIFTMKMQNSQSDFDQLTLQQKVELLQMQW